jgi:hypothetical protein
MNGRHSQLMGWSLTAKAGDEITKKTQHAEAREG